MEKYEKILESSEEELQLNDLLEELEVAVAEDTDAQLTEEVAEDKLSDLIEEEGNLETDVLDELIEELTPEPEVEIVIEEESDISSLDDILESTIEEAVIESDINDLDDLIEATELESTEDTITENIDSLLEELDAELETSLEEDTATVDAALLEEELPGTAELDALLSEMVVEDEVVEDVVVEEATLTEDQLEERNIVRLDKKSKKLQQINSAAIQIAKAKDKSNYAKYKKATLLRNKLEKLFIKKFRSQAIAAVKARK